VNVGDHYSGSIVGVMDYNFGNPFVEVTTPGLTAIHDDVTRETTDPLAPGELAVSTFNFENLAPTNPQSKFDSLASLIVNNLRSPDLIAGEEVQDNNGATDNGVVDASQTLSRLVAAIQAAGGPTYAWREIDPVNDQDGGEPGGNIRQVFLFRTAGSHSSTARAETRPPRTGSPAPAPRRSSSTARAASRRATEPGPPRASRWRQSSPTAATSCS
jgi:predicted extracellular nuclease